MSAALYVILGYMILDLLVTIAMIGRSIKITIGSALLALVTHGYVIFVILVAIGRLG